TLIAGWLLAHGNIKSPPGAMTIAPARPNDRITLNSNGTLSGRAIGVAFAREAEHIAVFADRTIALVETKACRLADGATMAGDSINAVTFDRTKAVARAPAPAGFDQTTLMLFGAVVRSVEAAGALEAILAMSVNYANERVAFERKIGKFQAVQQNL